MRPTGLPGRGMATQPGFPWAAPSRDPEKEGVTNPEQKKNTIPAHSEEEKRDEVKASISNHDSQPRKHSHSVRGRPHRASIKGPPRVSFAIPNLPTAPVSSKPTSPLPVRTIPRKSERVTSASTTTCLTDFLAWVRDAEEGDVEEPQFHIPDAPHSALVAHHHYSPSTSSRLPSHGKQHHENGFFSPSSRPWTPRTSRWISFARPSVYPHESFNSEKVDPDWLKSLTDYSRPWLADHDDDDVEDNSSKYRAFRRKRKVWYKRAQFTVLRNPFIPLIFRLIVMIFALTAMSLGISIYHESNKVTKCLAQAPKQRSVECILRVGATATDYYQDPSGLMAIIVDAIAVVYTLYITYDEYFSKPLGLRRARAKIRLVLLDLFFVVFQSASLALSFESLTADEGACKTSTGPSTAGKFEDICDRAEALSSVLLVSLTAWLLTFAVSVLRYVQIPVLA